MSGGPAAARRRSVEQHRAEVLSLLAAVEHRIAAEGAERLPVDDPGLLGQVTAETLSTDGPLPPFDNSQMDGYAVIAAELAAASAEHPVRLRLGRATAAGAAPLAHEPGSASPVMTGAPLPLGADAVVPVERTLPPRFPALSRAGGPAPDRDAEVAFAEPSAAGRFVRRAGEDLPAGSPVLDPGTRLTAARIGLIAAAGIAEVPVRRSVRVLLCSTGDELAERSAGGDGGSGDAPLRAGLIHDANTPMLAAALRAAGASVGTLRTGDTPERFRAALAEAAPGHDLVVTTGGISAGAFEVVREALSPLGVRFAPIAMQPGGPQGLGTLGALAGADRGGAVGDAAPGGAPGAAAAPGGAAAGIPVLCFPGNPVSALVSAEMFLLPELRRLAGLPAERRRERRPLAHAVEKPAEKHQVRRGRIDADGRVSLSAPGSHLLADLAAAELLAQLPPGPAELAENTPVEIWRIDD
ncbi:molybdopterin molybdotransferase MoeA [Leucobacter massiliensis]|uniref:Molybdopterin molybdenumtransferase n=1 Tax=Leucobacter massiliensis TaxID=1686285 RepID=A0A2S9QM42_9MICO|nr:molybdopterin molybdotransferase MoeA [Leucobacter massiliensis]PRI10670.1 hypothetical protein B4915_07130 [Leucobacter massiliensis]